MDAIDVVVDDAFDRSDGFLFRCMARIAEDNGRYPLTGQLNEHEGLAQADHSVSWRCVLYHVANLLVISAHQMGDTIDPVEATQPHKAESVPKTLLDESPSDD